MWVLISRVSFINESCSTRCRQHVFDLRRGYDVAVVATMLAQVFKNTLFRESLVVEILYPLVVVESSETLEAATMQHLQPLPV